MLRFLFPRLTKPAQRGQLLFDLAVEEARRPHWYLDGAVPDTIDGRFAMLATVCALAIVRVENEAGGGADASAAITERFIEAMDAEHRQMGINDPTLGKKVRRMVASLARRVDLWRLATAGEDWAAAAQSSVYGSGSPEPAQLEHCASNLRDLWQRLAASADSDVAEGRF